MAVTASDVSNAMAEYYRLRRDKAQFARSQDTLRFFRVGRMRMKGEEYHYKVFTRPLSGARIVGSATSVESDEWPAARKIGHVDVSVGWDDLYELRDTLEWTGLVAAKTKEQCVYRTAERYVTEVDANVGHRLNMAMHQPTCTPDAVTYPYLGQISAKYKIDGDTYAQATSAYLKVKSGSITQFVEGMVLSIVDANDGTVHNAAVTVEDVFHTSEGPDPDNYGDLGPGIRVSVATSNFDAAAADDYLVIAGETGGMFQNFAVWFSRTTSVFDITPTATGSAWSIPYMKDFQSGSADVAFDFGDHLGASAEEIAYFAQAVKDGRRERAKERIPMSQAAMTLLTTPRIVSEASTQVGDAVQYPEKIDPQERKRLFGTSGFDGAYYHHPALGPIAFASDPVATPSTLRLIEASSFFWILGHDGTQNTVEWLDKDGQRWHYEFGSNGRPKNIIVAGYLMRMALGNDQPRSNFQISGVKSSNE